VWKGLRRWDEEWVLKAFELPHRKDEATMIWMEQESTLSLFPLSMDRLRGIFLLGWVATGFWGVGGGGE